jgi:hypothetical protein
MRFVRHLAAVLLAVALVAAGGLAWEQASPPEAQRAFQRPIVVTATPGVPLVVHASPGQRIEIEHGPARPAGFRLDLGDLVRTAMAETLIMAVVVAISLARRRRTRRRTRTG